MMLLKSAVKFDLKRIVQLGRYTIVRCRCRNSSSSDLVEILDSPEEAVRDIKSNKTLMVGGFGLVGVPEALIRALSLRKDLKNMKVISNEGGVNHHGLDMMLEERQIKYFVCSFIGDNKNFQRQFFSGEIDVELVPQGTLVEKIRAGGAGIPGFYTSTGVNTLVHLGGEPIRFSKEGNVAVQSKPKEEKVFDGVTYILERSLTADYALIKGWKADKTGNIIFNKTAANFNLSMAKAARFTIAEVEEIVEIGELDPNFIHLPGIYVDRIVKPKPYKKIVEKLVIKSHSGSKVGYDPIRERIARRAALEFKNGMYANLGIGLPMLVADLIPSHMKVFLQAENGILGLGPYPDSPDQVDPDLINPGKETVTILPGGSFFSTDESFAMIRGHHLDLTMLGGMEVSSTGDLANWMIPGKLVKGMGGAMDLVGGAQKRVIVLMQHCSKNGEPKIKKTCDLPLTGYRVVDTIITEKCVFKVDKSGAGLILTEIAEGETVESIAKVTECDFKVADDVKPMGQIQTNK